MYKNILFLGVNCLRLLMLNSFHAGFYFTLMYSFAPHIYIYIYIYIYMCVCVCVCVCLCVCQCLCARARDYSVKYYGK